MKIYRFIYFFSSPDRIPRLHPRPAQSNDVSKNEVTVEDREKIILRPSSFSTRAEKNKNKNKAEREKRQVLLFSIFEVLMIAGTKNYSSAVILTFRAQQDKNNSIWKWGDSFLLEQNRRKKVFSRESFFFKPRTSSSMIRSFPVPELR